MKKNKIIFSIFFTSCILFNGAWVPIHANDDSDIATCDVLECEPTNSYRAKSGSINDTGSVTYGSFKVVASHVNKGKTPYHLQISKGQSISYTSTISGNIGFSFTSAAKALSLGLSTSQSGSYAITNTSAHTIDVPKGKSAEILARPAYMGYKATRQRYYTGNYSQCIGWRNSGTLSGKYFHHIDYGENVW